jgi:hypothetical protein
MALPAVCIRVGQAYKELFQPELISEDALKGEASLRRYASARAIERNLIHHQTQAQFKKWESKPEAEQYKFLSDVERGRPIAPADQKDANDIRNMSDVAYVNEKQWGSKADYVQNYISHWWDFPQRAQQLFQTLPLSMGPTAFQKARTIDFIDDGLAAGLKLKTANPFAILRQRLMAGADMRARMQLLHDWRSLYQAVIAKQVGPAASAQVRALERAGWQRLNAPNREQWLISPDVAYLWKNGVESRGFWADPSLAGDAFRAWMNFKAVWVPLKLTASAFHPLHVLGINLAQNWSRALDQAIAGDFAGAMKSFGQGLTPYSKYGREMRAQALLGDHARTPEGQYAVNLMKEGGFSPWQSEIQRGQAQEKLTKAWKAMNPFGIAWHGLQTALQKNPIQTAIFEHWIPELKTAAYLNDAAAVLKRDPSLQFDPARRRVALSAIAKSIDNRYGEMFYDGLAWNRYVRDAGVGSFLSLGWNLGFIREFGGAALEVPARAAAAAGVWNPSATRQLVMNSTNKIQFASIYFGTSLLMGGMMTYMLTGKSPEDIWDYIFPRVGGDNPDGSPRRLTTMFYTREIPMAQKHIEERGGGIGGTLSGLGAMVWNKMVFEPIVELANNKDYFGREIFDQNAPAYQQLVEAAQHIFGEQLSPMSFAGAQRATGATGSLPERLATTLTKPEGLLSYAGFSPAPSYANRSPLQNRIAFLYQQRSPGLRPYEDPEVTAENRAARDRLFMAKQRGDPAEIRAATAEATKAGLSATYIANLGKTGFDQYMFKKLPEIDQMAILRQATPAEQQRYMPFASVKTRIQWRKETAGRAA